MKKLGLLFCSLFVFHLLSAQELTFSGSFGTAEFDGCNNLAVDTDGNIFVIDEYHDRVLKYNSAHLLVKIIGSQGLNDGQFWDPNGIAIDADGNVFVSDRVLDNIQKFDNDGSFLEKWSGTPSGGTQDIDTPNDIAIDSKGNVYISNDGNLQVLKLDKDGNYVTHWDVDGTDGNFFLSMTSIAVDNNDNVFVIDGDVIKKYDENGTFLTSWGGYGTSNNKFSSYVSGLATDADGNVYVGDSYAYQIKVFDNNGNFITKFGTQGSGDGQFNFPSGISVNASGEVFVADFSNNRVVKLNTTIITSLDDASEEKKFDYTNPVENLMLLNADRSATAIVSDLNGVELLTFEIEEGNNQIDMSGLPSNLYIIRFDGADIAAIKFLKK